MIWQTQHTILDRPKIQCFTFGETRDRRMTEQNKTDDAIPWWSVCRIWSQCGEEVFSFGICRKHDSPLGAAPGPCIYHCVCRIYLQSSWGLRSLRIICNDASWAWRISPDCFMPDCLALLQILSRSNILSKKSKMQQILPGKMLTCLVEGVSFVQSSETYHLDAPGVHWVH